MFSSTYIERDSYNIIFRGDYGLTCGCLPYSALPVAFPWRPWFVPICISRSLIVLKVEERFGVFTMFVLHSIQ